MNKTILAIDFGVKRIGLALMKKETDVVFPWGVLNNDGALLNSIRTFVSNEEVEIVVVGLPLNLDGNETRSSYKVRGFVKSLKDSLDCEIKLIDERFTTTEAKSEIVKNGAGLDERAAQLILESYVQHNSK